jgi:hypothetical protein
MDDIKTTIMTCSVLREPPHLLYMYISAPTDDTLAVESVHVKNIISIGSSLGIHSIVLYRRSSDFPKTEHLTFVAFEE